MVRLTDESFDYLKYRRPKFEGKDELAIAFIGDTHIGQTTYGPLNNRKICECKGTCIENYYEAMLRHINSNKGILAVVHGGDDTDHNLYNLQRFKEITREALNYDSNKINGSILPIFSNVGNHDYSNKTLDNFNAEIGDTNYLIELYRNPDKTNHRIAVAMLNTGYTASGYAVNKSIDKLKEKMTAYSTSEYTKYIIDMHIPPRINNGDTGQSHFLAIQYNAAFRQLLQSYKNQIIAVVAHHKHGYIQTQAIHLVSSDYNIPLFITAQGGNCDPLSEAAKNNKDKKDAHYSYYIMKLKKSNSNYVISSVYRYDAIPIDKSINVIRSKKIDL